jgi:putative flippase GtrA
MVVASPDAALGRAPARPFSTAIVPWPAGPTAHKERIRTRLLRVLRMLIVGFWASLIDLGVITLCVRCMHLEATLSRLIALAVSGLCLFFGCRSFAFRAQSGSISRQARLFVLGELLGFPLNLLVFHALEACAPFLAPEFASQAANFLVFVAFAYPVRRLLVFQQRAPSAPLGAAGPLPVLTSAARLLAPAAE